MIKRILYVHAHLPFVKHPEIEDCLEERWLLQAITETYTSFEMPVQAF